MALNWDDLEPRKPAPPPMLGADLSQFSARELEEYLEVLRGEIDRVSMKIKEKQFSRNAANSVFKTGG